MPPADETLGQRIARLRKAKGWSQRDLARELAGALASQTPAFVASMQTQISRWEKDHNLPVLSRIREILKLLGDTDAGLITELTVREQVTQLMHTLVRDGHHPWDLGGALIRLGVVVNGWAKAR